MIYLKENFLYLGRVACGKPIFADEDKDCFIMADSDINADFCLICKSDSMLPMIHNGDIVFIKKQPSVNNGEVAVVITDGEATLKRVYQSNDILTLIPENKSYKPIVIKANENNSIQIVGKAAFYQSIIK